MSEFALGDNKQGMPNANDMDLVREYATRNSEPALNRIVHKPEKAGRRNLVSAAIGIGSAIEKAGEAEGRQYVCGLLEDSKLM